jgi:hypothetical protein
LPIDVNPKRNIKPANQNTRLATVKMSMIAINGATQKNYSHKIPIMDSYSITEICPHDIAEIRVIESIATCETTVIVCTQCGEHLSTPKTEC